MNPIDKVLTSLDCKPAGNGRFKACCPAHEDKTPSLTIQEASNGKVLLHCFAGCEVQDVVESMGLKMDDLFPDDCVMDYVHDKSEQIAHERLVLAMLKAKKNSGATIEPIELNRAELALHRLRGAS